MCPLIAFPACHPHPFESSSISIRTAVYPSMQITQFPASCYFVCHTSQKNCYQHAFRAWVPEKRGWTDFAANPPFCRWSLRFGSFWRQTGAPQGHPYPPVKSKYLNGISSLKYQENFLWDWYQPRNWIMKSMEQMSVVRSVSQKQRPCLSCS